MLLLDLRALRDLRLAALATALSLVATPVLAQQVNLVTNESFDVDVMDWEPVEGFMSIVFDAEDVDGDKESGSARITFNPTLDTSMTGHVAQCVQVVPGETYTGSVSFMIPTGQDRMGSAGLRTVWYESDDCSGPSPEFGFGLASDFEGAWVDLAPFEFVPPQDVFSAEVELQIQKPVLGGTLEIFFDEVMFLPEPSPLLGGLVAILSSVGVARWTRRRESRRRGRRAPACESGCPPGRPLPRTCA